MNIFAILLSLTFTHPCIIDTIQNSIQISLIIITITIAEHSPLVIIPVIITIPCA